MPWSMLLKLDRSLQSDKRSAFQANLCSICRYLHVFACRQTPCLRLRLRQPACIQQGDAFSLACIHATGKFQPHKDLENLADLFIYRDGFKSADLGTRVLWRPLLVLRTRCGRPHFTGLNERTADLCSAASTSFFEMPETGCYGGTGGYVCA